VVANEADVREQLVTPENVQRARAAPHLDVVTYRGNVYTYFGFNLRANGDTSQPHPIFGDREVRRALSMAVDRAALVKSALGDLGKVPPARFPSYSGSGIRRSGSCPTIPLRPDAS